MIFEENIDPICSSFPCQTVAKYIEALEREKNEHSQKTFLPVLGKTPPALFLQIYQITWLSRQLPFDCGDHYALTLECLDELENIKRSCPIVGYEDVLLPSATSMRKLSNSETSAKLYFLATQIFIAKVLDPQGISSSSPRIEELTAPGTALLEVYDATAACGQYICWPLLILGCAACPVTFPKTKQNHQHDPGEQRRAQLRSLIQKKLIEIWKVSYSGYAKRTACALDRIWQLPSILAKVSNGTTLSPEIEYDGLNALIYNSGLGSALLSPDTG